MVNEFQLMKNIPKYVCIYSVQLVRYAETFSGFNLEKSNFYNHTSRCLKMSDDIILISINSTEWPANSADKSPLDNLVCTKSQHTVYQHHALELLQH
jgi:hypothetical protein